jgi:hypothetical protein
VVLGGIVLYVVLTVCMALYVSPWAGVALALGVPVVILLAVAVDRKAWPWDG